MPVIEIQDNTGAVLEALRAAEAEALEAVGRQWESRAKELAPPKWGAELRDSITHSVEGQVLSVGSGMEIAAYAELGTGKEYQPPPEWLENHVPRGSKVPVGADHWIYYDSEENESKVGKPQPASPYLRPAFENNRAEYQRIFEDVLKNAGGQG